MPLSPDDELPMQQAIRASRDALDAGNMPFGATLVDRDGQLRHVAQNTQVTTQDCTAHAELVLVREVAQSLGTDVLRGATVYASGEPCAMCAGAMFWAGIARVVYAASTAEIGATLGGPLLPSDSRRVLAGAQPAVQVDGPLQGAEAVAVLREAALRGTGASAP